MMVRPTTAKTNWMAVTGGILESMQDWDPRGHRVVQLDQDDERDAHVGVEDAKGGGDRVEGLSDQDSAPDHSNRRPPVLSLACKKLGAKRVLRACQQDEAEHENVQPVNQERHAKGDEVGEQPGRERNEG